MDGDGGSCSVSPGRLWGVLAVLAAVQFVNVVDFMLVMPLGPVFMKAFGVGPGPFGVMVASYTIAAGLAGVTAALFIDRFDRRTALLLLFAGVTAGTVACALAPTFELLVAARVFTGLFGGVLGAVVFAVIGDAVPPERRGTATGVVMSSFAVASVFGVPFGLELGNRFGWRVPFLALAGAGVVVWAAGWLVLPPVRKHLSARRAGNAVAGLVEVLVEPSHVRAFAVMATMMIGGFTLLPFVSAILVANAGVAQEQLTWVYVCGGVAAFAMSPVAGRLSDRVGALAVFRVTALLSAVPLVLLANLGPAPLAVALCVTTLVFFANTGRMVSAMTLVQAAVAPGRRGAFMSVNSALQNLSAGVGSLIASVLIVEVDGRLVNLNAAAWVGVAAIVASVALAGRLKRERRRAAEPVELAAAEA